MGLTKKTASRWRGESPEWHDVVIRDLREGADPGSPNDRAAAVLEDVARPRGVTRLEIMAATLLEEQATFWMRNDSMAKALRDAGLWLRRQPTKRGTELLRRVRAEAAAGRLPKPRRAG